MSNLIAVSIFVFAGLLCKKKLWRLLALLFVVTCAAESFAQKPTYGNYTVRNFRHGDGLIDAQVNVIHKDNDGFVWLGTPSNVQRFDGVRNVMYGFDGPAANVNTIFQGDDDRILAGTDRGVFLVNHRDKKLSAVYPEIKTSVTDIVEHGGCLLIASSGGLYRISSGGSPEKIDLGSSEYFSIDGDKETYLLAPDGLGVYADGSLKEYGKGNIASRLTCMADLGKSLLIGSEENGLYSFDKRTRCFSHYLDIGNNCITSVDANSGMIVVGTDGSGIYVFSESDPENIFNLSFHPENKGSHLAFDKVKSVLMDDLGIIWISYSRNVGFDYIQFHNKAFNLFSSDNRLPVDIDFSRVYVCDSLKLFSSFNGVYSIDPSGKVAYHKFPNASRSGDKDVTCFYPFGNDILIGTTNGLYRYSHGIKTFQQGFDGSGLEGAHVKSMAADAEGSLYVATDSGVYVLNGSDGALRVLTRSDSGLASDNVSCMFIDGRGKKWVATARGMQIFDDKSGRFTGAGRLFDDLNSVTFITEDNKNRLIVIQDRQEAYLFDEDLKERRRICTSEDAGFLGLFLEKVLQDKDGNYWFIGSRGVVKGNPSLTEYTLFSSTEGLVEPYSNDGQIFNDTLWITTPKGVLYSFINAPIHSAPTRITDIVINGESRMGEYAEAVKNGQEIDLSDSDSNITFSFATLSFDIPNRMIYEYKLEGHDDNWIILRGNNSVSYRNLRPGSYRFVVRKQMDDSSMQYVSFSVPYKLPWTAVWIISTVLFVLVGAVLFRRHVKRGEKVQAVADVSEHESQPKDADKYKFNKLKDDTVDSVCRRLNEYMIAERPYLNPDLKLINVADKLNVTPQVLSQVLNTRLNVRFNDFINQFRVDAFKEYVSSADMSKYTLQSLASKCGFSSYSTFFRAFKELTGLTPNEYLKGKPVASEGSEND